MSAICARARGLSGRFVRGVAALLGEIGQFLPGVDLLIDGDLPLGSGLSSSASLELGVAAALTALAGFSIDRTALARLGQRVENEIVGVQSGIMDQLAVACGVAGHALLIDCRTFVSEPVPLPPTIRLLVLDSAVPRTLAGSAYNPRRAECESALHKLQSAHPDLKALRDVSADLLALEGWRLEPVELRRARHVVTENSRVQDSVAALRVGDIARFGQLMIESHASLRDDYAVSGPELDMLVAAALETPGVIGARLTGAGFGGCAVALVRAAQAELAAKRIAAQYQQASGRIGAVYICTPSDGVSAEWVANVRAKGECVIPEIARKHQLPRRSIAVLVALLLGLALLIASSIGVWKMAHTRLDLFIVPNATDIQVQWLSFGEQQIIYRAAGSPYGWYFAVARNLAADG